jgi:PAS domain S-box-containing protein
MREPRWKELADGLCDAIVVIDDRDRVSYANAAACQLLGYTTDTLVGELAAVLVPERHRIIDGTPFHRYLAARSPTLMGRAIKVPARRKEDVEIVVGWIGSASADGSEVQLVMRRLDEVIDLAADPIEERPSADHTGQLLEQIFVRSPIGIFHFDAAGVITACNDRFVQMLGGSKRSLIGLDMTTLVDERIRECVKQACAGEAAQFEGEYTPVTGSRSAHVRGVFSPIADGEGRIAGGIGIFEDVSERIHVERALARSDRMASLGTLAAGVAHELNTPLAYVLSSLEGARAHLTAAEIVRIREAVETIDTAIEGTLRMRDIVRELRSFAQEGEPQLGPVDPRAAIESAIRLAWPRTHDRVRIRAELAPDVPTVLASEQKLVQVIVNLLVNARDATEQRKGGSSPIEVVLRVEGGGTENGEVVIDVRDRGVGIPRENLERIFDPFWSTKRSGLGIGLSLSHSIVTSFGGRIEAESEVGHGSTFRVYLRPTEPVDERARVPEPESRARILIIEDEPRLAFTLKIALEGDHDVVTATRGRDAIELLMRDQAFDLILSDLTIPDVNGQEIYDRIRSKTPDLAARFVFMTGGAFTEPMRAFLASCDNLQLDKPFDVAEVTRALAHVRRRRNGTRAESGSAGSIPR